METMKIRNRFSIINRRNCTQEINLSFFITELLVQQKFLEMSFSHKWLFAITRGFGRDTCGIRHVLQHAYHVIP